MVVKLPVMSLLVVTSRLGSRLALAAYTIPDRFWTSNLAALPLWPSGGLPIRPMRLSNASRDKLGYMVLQHPLKVGFEAKHLSRALSKRFRAFYLLFLFLDVITRYPLYPRWQRWSRKSCSLAIQRVKQSVATLEGGNDNDANDLTYFVDGIFLIAKGDEQENPGVGPMVALSWSNTLCTLVSFISKR